MLSVVPECQNNESLVSCSVKNCLQVVMMSESSGCLCDSISNITNFNSFHWLVIRGLRLYCSEGVTVG